MKIESRYITDKVRAAEFEEVRDSESQFFAELANILTPEALEEGVRIDFGPDKKRFAQVIEMLALDEAIKGENPSAHIHNITANDFAGYSGFHGKAIKPLSQLPLAEMPDVVQSGMLHSYKRHNLYPTLDPSKDMVTAVIVANIDKDSPEKYSDLSKPGVTLGVIRQYLPEFKVPEYDAKEDLARTINDNRENHEANSTAMATIAGKIAVDGYQLANPESNYFIEIGPLRFTPFFTFQEVVGNYVAKDGYFTLVDGHLEMYVDTDDRDLEDILPELV